MSITGSSNTLTQAAQAAAAANLAAANTAAAASSSGTSTTATNPLAQLGANFNQFLQLLLTQVQNQDPTDPTNTDEFTTELVQFTGVQEQVNANTSLGQLITLQQSSQVLQSAGLVGKQATVSADEIALQNGTGEVSFTGTANEPVAISIVNSSGQDVRDVSLTAAAGTNSWTWDGTDNNGNALPDGAYGIAVETQTGTATTAVPFSVIGTTTGVTTTGTTTMLDIGALSVPISALQGINSN